MKKPQKRGNLVNRRARYDYELGESLVAGLQLSGAETKALRMGRGQLTGSYVTVKGNELWLIGAQINPAPGLEMDESMQNRSRKILAKRREIDSLIEQKKQGKTIVPLEFLVSGRYIKLIIAPGKGKRRYDKRETIKRRQQEREISRQTKR